MPTRICILALIGLPAAGKTTFCKWVALMSKSSFNVIHICYDDHLQLPQNSASKDFQFRDQRTEILSTISSLVGALNNNGTVPDHINFYVKNSENSKCRDYLILCDDNNYYRSMRYKLYQLCKQNKCAYGQIYFNCDLQLALIRNNTRGSQNRVSDEILKRMENRLEKPTDSQQHWEANTFILDASENYEAKKMEILRYLCKTFENVPESQMVDTKVGTEQSLAHKLDLLLRRRIREILQSKEDTAGRQKIAQNLNAKRQQILHEIRSKAEENNLKIDDIDKFIEHARFVSLDL
ncbi:unnamed protein product [Ceratitis capitata]|uniref:(Mediterranean fruit fly) hypothetical protein n=1 Tax=Ceratitis capitata TaxID=7213 RepID=A0A811U0S9_CERCA|nr:unnamed protein product [Ceratitis capitata]